MKYEITPCTQCGTEFKRTNARHLYCSGACRVSAHRDRHGYEQPIFTYPSIRAVEQIRALNIEDLQRISLYALCFLDSLQEKGETIPPTTSHMDMRRMSIQLRIELERVNQTAEIIEALKPIADLIELVKKIKDDAP